MILIHPTLDGVTLEAHGSADVAQAVRAGWVKPDQGNAPQPAEDAPKAPRD